MLQRLERLFHHQNPDLPRQLTISFGPITVQVDAGLDLMIANYCNTSRNLLEAAEIGIKPLSYKDVATQITPEDLPNTVLYDTASIEPGNHWRIIRTNEKSHHVTLQHCNEFGNYDHIKIPPIEIPFLLPLFTGVSIQKFTYNGKPAPLSQVAQLVNEAKMKEKFIYPEELKHINDVIMFSDQVGTLQPYHLHPYFSAHK